MNSSASNFVNELVEDSKYIYSLILFIEQAKFVYIYDLYESTNNANTF